MILFFSIGSFAVFDLAVCTLSLGHTSAVWITMVTDNAGGRMREKAAQSNAEGASLTAASDNLITEPSGTASCRTSYLAD